MSLLLAGITLGIIYGIIQGYTTEEWINYMLYRFRKQWKFCDRKKNIVKLIVIAIYSPDLLYGLLDVVRNKYIYYKSG